MTALHSPAATNPKGEPVAVVGLSVERVLAAAGRILTGNVLCSVATVGPDNRAHINTAYFAYTDDFRICFLSHPASRHCQNIGTNPTMAIAVYSSAQKWTEPDAGLQLFGSCRPAKGSEGASAAEVYARRFPEYTPWAASLKEDDAGREYQFLWFVARAIKVVDEREFGDGVFVSAAII
jgi:uncharacterized protein YhbP (UPF0306 family)